MVERNLKAAVKLNRILICNFPLLFTYKNCYGSSLFPFDGAGLVTWGVTIIDEK